jgi:hydrogenase 3 maturation protease
MSNISWSGALKQTLASLRQHEAFPRAAIVGMGHELRGDDAAGLMIAQALKELAVHQAHLLVIEGGSAPENTTSVLRRFAPDMVLLVDAADMDAPPGSVRWLSWETTTGLSASTHTLPPALLARYLRAELGCVVALIGIQPAHLTIDSTVSPVVKAAVDSVVEVLVSVFR